MGSLGPRIGDTKSKLLVPMTHQSPKGVPGTLRVLARCNGNSPQARLTGWKEQLKVSWYRYIYPHLFVCTLQNAVSGHDVSSCSIQVCGLVGSRYLQKLDDGEFWIGT